jgi:hypothetical protein
MSVLLGEVQRLERYVGSDNPGAMCRSANKQEYHVEP